MTEIQNHQPEQIEHTETPAKVLEYLQSKHETIINDYQTPDGEYGESCTLIASDIAKMFLQEGKKPYIIMVRPEVNKTLKPSMYKGRVSWGAHQVCCCDGKAYDPIIGTPQDIGEYTQSVFGQEVKTEIAVPSEEIEEFINR